IRDLIKSWDDVDCAYGDGIQTKNPEFLDQRQFLAFFYKLVHAGAALELTDEENVLALYNECYELIERVEAIWPASKSDGVTNTWIVKPGARSRGRGILVLNKLDSIMQFSKPMSNIIQQDESRYVVQKYLETPLLIHGYKFDIRQWFLITDWSPLTIWMYNECYLRFCTQPFSLTNLHESVHLNNFAVQKNYTMTCPEDIPLPRDKMWDSETFKQYLDSCGLFTAYENVVYPGMRDVFVASMLAAQENAEPRANAFEVYGVDFMLTSDCKPWIIEINSSPDLNHSTPVTTRLVPQMFEDLIKVLIDRRVDRNAETGGYQMVYRQQPAVTPFSSLSLDLKVVGKRIAPAFPPNAATAPTAVPTTTACVAQKIAFGARHSIPPSPWSRILMMAQNEEEFKAAKEEAAKSAMTNFGQILVGKKKPMITFGKSPHGDVENGKISLSGFCTPRRGQRSASVAPVMSSSAPASKRISVSSPRNPSQSSPEERMQRLAVLATPKRARKPLIIASSAPSVVVAAAAAKQKAPIAGPAAGRRHTGADWRKNLAA
ncbi:unnamed protein product, partial [Notodromas monacha]